MRRLIQLTCLLITLIANAGCASIAENLFDSAINAACGEGDQERRDREQMESYRKSWSTPGRNAAEVEIESRGTFRKAYGREPNLNWHAR